MNEAANLKPLTSLRFFAALWVVLYSYWPKLDVTVSPLVVEKGYLGVELFFVLSGFILCHVYLQGFGEGRFRYGAFLWNRLARIYPMHLATLAAVAAIGVAGTLAGMSVDPGMTDWASLPANLLLVHAWGFAPTSAFNHPSWSISAEWFAYLSFPAFAWAAWRLRARPWLAVGLAWLLIAVLYPLFQSLMGFSLTEATIRWGALRIVPCFAYGCAIHALWRSGAVKSKGLAMAGAAISGAAALLAAQFGAPDALVLAFFGGLILSLAGMASTGSAFGSHPVFVYLGEISYSVYMIAAPWGIVFVNITAKLLGLTEEKLPLGIWLLFVAAIVPLSAATYHLIERPARARMKLVADGLKARRLAAAGAA
jgi:peptidoglycan/LPS O-acetylase OafA/YrhL